jgi:hypothetical protein
MIDIWEPVDATGWPLHKLKPKPKTHPGEYDSLSWKVAPGGERYLSRGPFRNVWDSEE